MKKILILVTFWVAAISTTDAQIMIRGGVNFSDIAIDSDTHSEVFDRKPGFHVGLNGNLAIGNLLNLRPAVLYHLKGADVTTGGNTGAANLHYLEVPVNLGISIGPLVVEAGPYFGYLLNSDTGVLNQESFDRSDWGANFGAILELSDIGIGLNYSNSLSNIAKDDRWGQATKLTNGNLSIFAYYKM